MENIPPEINNIEPNYWEALKNPDSLFYAFWLSVALLVFMSLLKYLVSKESERKDWGLLALELPIDLCLVVITVIITGFMKEPNFALGIVLVVISLVVSIICYHFRQCSIRHSYDEKGLKV
ncbi:hypothetical protein, partial [uncultured Bacteroides sp.]|uniref:hypothetical protein n=1 Tax=uncultured Bacteroides sp. TaxID=162156 RepID=UPI0032201E09